MREVIVAVSGLGGHDISVSSTAGHSRVTLMLWNGLEKFLEEYIQATLNQNLYGRVVRRFKYNKMLAYSLILAIC